MPGPAAWLAVIAYVLGALVLFVALFVAWNYVVMRAILGAVAPTQTDAARHMLGHVTRSDALDTTFTAQTDCTEPGEIQVFLNDAQLAIIKEMMRKRHPEANHVATDRHFINPFGRVRRRSQANQAQEQ